MDLERGSAMAWWLDLVDLVLPVDCAGCGAPRQALCDPCERELREASGLCRVWPRPCPPGLPRVYAAAEYADVVRAALLAHKERGALRLATPLGAGLAAAVTAVLRGPGALGAGLSRSSAGGTMGRAEEGGAVWLTPVPSARRAVASRGHDPTLRLARTAAARLRGVGVDVRVLPALRQARGMADQAGLSAEQRSRNVSGAFDVPAHAHELLGRARVVLVDDLMTTGASLAEAARALGVAGGRIVGAAVVAAPAGAARRVC